MALFVISKYRLLGHVTSLFKNLSSLAFEKCIEEKALPSPTRLEFDKLRFT